jgi:RNA recognition motif-containing protein
MLTDIQNLFGEFGPIKNVRITRGSEDDRALVEFKKNTDALLA